MSWEASKWAVKAEAGSSGAKGVLLVLAEACRDDACFLSHETIAQRAETSRRSVIRHMKELEDAGLIVRERRSDGAGNRTTDMIRLQRTEAFQGDNLALGQGADLARGDGALGAKPAGAKVPKTPPLGAKLAHEPMLEPVSNPSEGASPARRKPETTIPDGFPDEAAIAAELIYFREKAVNIDPRTEAEKFRSHSLANDRRCRNWGQAFHNWAIRAVQYAPASARGFVRETDPAAAPDPWVSRVTTFKRNAYWNTNEWGPKPGKAGCNAPADLLIAKGYSPDGDDRIVLISKAASA